MFGLDDIVACGVRNFCCGAVICIVENCNQSLEAHGCSQGPGGKKEESDCRSHSTRRPESGELNGPASGRRVEMWRGGVRFVSTVAAPFVWRCRN